MARRATNRLFVVRAVDVNKAVTRVSIVLFRAFQPKNARKDKIIARGWRLLGRERNPIPKDRAAGQAGPNLFADGEMADRCFHAAFFGTETVARSRDRITGEQVVAGCQVQALSLNRNANQWAGCLHLKAGAIDCAR